MFGNYNTNKIMAEILFLNIRFKNVQKMLTRSLDPNDCKQKQKSTKEMKSKLSLSKINQIILEKQSQI